MTPQQALAHLVAGKDLSREEMRAVMMAVMTGETFSGDQLRESLLRCHG